MIPLRCLFAAKDEDSVSPRLAAFAECVAMIGVSIVCAEEVWTPSKINESANLALLGAFMMAVGVVNLRTL